MKGVSILSKERLTKRYSNVQVAVKGCGANCNYGYEYCVNHACKVGDTVYVICECENIPPQLDGTLYGANGESGTATGYYCPYEESCPHECEECDDLFDCDKFKTKQAVFKDEVEALWFDEDGLSIITLNCHINSHIGEFVFLTQSEAEEKLRELEGK